MAKCIRPEKKDWRAKTKDTARKYCYTCSRPSRVCLCNSIKIENNTCEIGILQHPNEVGKTFNTAKVAQLSLSKSFLITGIAFDDNLDFKNTLNAYDLTKVGVLYPSSTAIPLSDAPKDLQCLFVVDGTWPEAKKILNQTQAFNTIQHYGFIPKSESRYVLRKEPSVDYVCSLEAIVESLRILESNDQAYDSLIRTLDVMLQLQADLKNTNSRHKSSPEFMVIKNRIKEIKRLLYTTNSHIDKRNELLIELNKLEQKIY